MEKITRERMKLTFVGLGTIIAVGTPAIIVGSIFALNNNESVEKTNLVNFYKQHEGTLFDRNNFNISQPNPTTDGRFLVENVSINNIIFLPLQNLRNYSYNIEIIEIIPNISQGTLQFKYKVFSIINPSIEITKISESYIGFFDNFQNFQLFSK
ncbi:MAG: hypothetical protein ACRC1F_02225 [Metamycoplasmataceae bacterium]